MEANRKAAAAAYKAGSTETPRLGNLDRGRTALLRTADRAGCAETRGRMYRAVGHILGLVPEVETACDGWISSSPLAAMSEFMFRFALPIMPDGLVIERE